MAVSLYARPHRLEELDYERHLMGLAAKLEFLMNDFRQDPSVDTRLQDQLQQERQELELLLVANSPIIDPADGNLHLVRVCGLDFGDRVPCPD